MMQIANIEPAKKALSRYSTIIPDTLIHDILLQNVELMEENNANSIGDTYPREWLIDEVCIKLKAGHWPSNGDSEEYAANFQVAFCKGIFNYRADLAIRMGNRAELHRLGVKALERCNTRHLLSMLPHHLGHYNSPDEDKEQSEWIWMIKSVLATREHIPNKREGRALRREASKRKT
jgi:hypothetical protein